MLVTLEPNLRRSLARHERSVSQGSDRPITDRPAVAADVACVWTQFLETPEDLAEIHGLGLAGPIRDDGYKNCRSCPTELTRQGGKDEHAPPEENNPAPRFG